MKRIHMLKEEVLIYEETTYQTIRDVYQSVYSDFNALLMESPGRSNESCARELAERFNYKSGNILRIYQIMSTDTNGTYFSKKKRLTKTETFNRDKALFIDFLRWPGRKPDFYAYGAEKYNLKPYYVYVILKYCLYADPKRYDLV